MRTHRSLKILIFVLLGALVGAACSSDSESSSDIDTPEEWAVSVCEAAGRFVDDLEPLAERAQSVQAEIGDEPEDIAQLAELFEFLGELLTGFAGGMQQWADDIEALGPPPDTPNGAALHGDVVETISGAAETLAEGAEAVSGIDENSSLEEIFALEGEFSELEEEFDSLDNPLDTLEDDVSDELSDAFDESETCNEVEERFEEVGSRFDAL